jgi:hypothetical protein
LGFLLAPAQALGAGKIRWVRSIYTDGQGVGLKNPEGVACSGDSFVVADTGNSRLLRYRYDGENLAVEAAFPIPKSSPVIVQVSSRGELYYLDGRERRIATVSAAGEAKGFLTPKHLPSSAKVIPKSFRIGENDVIYILDVFSERVLVLDAAGGYLSQIPFPEEYGFFSDLALDPQGGILLLDSVEAAVYAAPKHAESFSRLTGGMKEYMNFPTSLATDKRGMIYLIDQYGSGLAVLAQDGSFLGRKLGMGWNESRLFYPSQICIDQGGNMLIADRNNSRVQLFSLVDGD